ncbi:hypothetical protein EYC84_010374 [Monilinia fructicola]|uniref:DUF7707 domain-containing protein n=1 Tax=Monilinia fructicola TaxID=38448 RepID=A0A5M9JHZ1_MONFR|nr:hypothetical protein EYC84_010374 [Monilinia fructicola]
MTIRAMRCDGNVMNDNANDANNTIDPNTVDPSLRSQWCTGEINTCGTLCSGDYDSNTCDTSTLNYTCTCSSNGSTPGLQYYLQTMPTFICARRSTRTVLPQERTTPPRQKLCTQAETKNCGKLDPDKYVPAATSSAASSSASATATSSSTATSATASAATSSAAASALNIGREYGTGIFAAGVFGIFGLML